MKTTHYGTSIDNTRLQSTLMVIAVLLSLIFAFQIRPNGFSGVFNATQEQESTNSDSRKSGLTSVDPLDSVGDSEAGQSEVSDHSQYPERTFSSKHVFQLLLIGTLIIWGYSLVMSGKNGQGWTVLIALLGIFRYVGRFIRSLFVEVTSKNEVRDWDDD